MICTKHNIPMKALFTSLYCDKCDSEINLPKRIEIMGMIADYYPDSVNEVLIKEGVDISYINSGHAPVSYNFESGTIGIVNCAAIRDHGVYATMTIFDEKWGKILLNKEAAPLLGLAIGGSILKRNIQNTNIIEQATIDQIALTYRPTNLRCKILNITEKDNSVG